MEGKETPKRMVFQPTARSDRKIRSLMKESGTTLGECLNLIIESLPDDATIVRRLERRSEPHMPLHW